MKIKSFIKYIFFIFFLVFFLEFFSRILFPELNITMTGPLQVEFGTQEGKKLYFKRYDNLKVRENIDNEKLKIFSGKKILILGDSISAGYGVLLKDIYYKKLQLILDSEKIKTTFVNLATFGSQANLKSYLITIKNNKFLLKPNDLVLYQFNYNDILDNNSDNSIESYRGQSEKNNFLNKLAIYTANFRYKILNKSNFLRVMQHYASLTIKKTTGSCEERGIDSLGVYTYTYGAKGYKYVSNKYWKNFEKDLQKLVNHVTNEKKAKFAILLVPPPMEIIYHNKSNIYNYNLSCKTIEPKKKLKEFSIKYGFDIIDSSNLFIQESNRIYQEEGIVNHFFIKYDINHPNENGHGLIAIKLMPYVRNFYLNNN